MAVISLNAQAREPESQLFDSLLVSLALMVVAGYRLLSPLSCSALYLWDQERETFIKRDSLHLWQGLARLLPQL